jgi:hypothetical protein
MEARSVVHIVGAHYTPLAFSTENPPQTGTRRAAGVVERGGLENR